MAGEYPLKRYSRKKTANGTRARRADLAVFKLVLEQAWEIPAG